MTHFNDTGYLELFIGPMFSGKTSRLIEIFKREEFCGQNPIVVNFSDDDRYDNYTTHLSTHDARQIPCIRAKNLKDIFDSEQYYKTFNYNLKYVNDDLLSSDDVEKNNLIKSIVDPSHPTYSKTILINEGQFFPDILNWTKLMVTHFNKRVYIAALDGDFEQQPIGDILQLIPYSNKCTKLTSLCYDCKDGTEAIFSFRITNEKEQIVIGSDNYIPLCRKCYIQKQKLNSNKTNEKLLNFEF